jgi:hypothetical protein
MRCAARLTGFRLDHVHSLHVYERHVRHLALDDLLGPFAADEGFRTGLTAHRTTGRATAGAAASHAGRKRIQAWIAGFGDRLAAAGESGYIMRGDLDELAAMPATAAVRLLSGYDQWVLGPGTADAHVVPPARRTLVSHQANIVIVGGVVSGTAHTGPLHGAEELVTALVTTESVPAAAQAADLPTLTKAVANAKRAY